MANAWLTGIMIACLYWEANAALGTTWSTPSVATRNGEATITLPEDEQTLPTLTIAGATAFNVTSQTPINFFNIALNGLLTLQTSKVLDFETNPLHELVVEASDASNPPLTATLSLTLNLTDVNDNPPKFSQDVFLYCLKNGTAKGTEVHTVSMTDLDTTVTENVVSGYQLTGVGSGDFKISSVGVITTDEILGSRFVYAIAVTATDSDTGGYRLTGTATLVVTVPSHCGACSGVVIVAASLITMFAGLLATVS